MNINFIEFVVKGFFAVGLMISAFLSMTIFWPHVSNTAKALLIVFCVVFGCSAVAFSASAGESYRAWRADFEMCNGSFPMVMNIDGEEWELTIGNSERGMYTKSGANYDIVIDKEPSDYDGYAAELYIPVKIVHVTPSNNIFTANSDALVSSSVIGVRLVSLPSANTLDHMSFYQNYRVVELSTDDGQHWDTVDSPMSDALIGYLYSANITYILEDEHVDWASKYKPQSEQSEQ